VEIDSISADCARSVAVAVIVGVYALVAERAPREAAAQNELMRAFQPCPPSGKPDIEPTPPNDRV
jgi:hypothetical protein